MSRIRSLVIATTAALAVASAAEANTLRWGADRDVLSMDPYSYGDTFTLAFLNHVYEGLVRYDENLEIEPALAESWEVLDDGVTWRFRLRQGVSFHNGSPFTADDVIASLARVSHETSPLKGNLPAYASSNKVDDHTVDIVVNDTYPLLLNDLTNIHIFDHEWLVEHNAEVPTDAGRGVEGYPTFNANGTGPFIVESYQPDSRTVLVVNPDWWDQPVHNLTRIEFLPISSAATRVAALLSGEIDFTNLAPVQDLPRLEASPDIRLLERSDLRTIMIGFNRGDRLNHSTNLESNPLNDRRVRQALYQAMNADLIRDRVMRGKSRNTGSLVAPEIPGYAPELDERLPFDLDRATALLAEAGYPDGFAFDFNCMNEGGYVNEEELCQAIAAMWSRAGLQPMLDIAPRTSQVPKRTGGRTDVYTFGWATEPMIDAYSLLIQVLHSKTGTAGVFNWGGWIYPDLDALTREAGRTLDREQRLDMQTRALKIAKDDIIFIPLHQQPMAWAARDNIAHMTQLADNKVRLWLTRMQ